MTAGESDSSIQLVGSTPQQTGRSTTMEEMGMPGQPLMWGLHTNMDNHLSLRLPLSVGEVHLLPHQTGEHWTDGYLTASKTTGHWCCCRGHRGSREKKQLALARLDMPIFKSTDPGVEVTNTLDGVLMWMPSLNSMTRPVCAPISLPVSTGTQVNGPTP